MRLFTIFTLLTISLVLAQPAQAKVEDCVFSLNPFRWVSCVFTPLEPEWEGESEGDN